MTKRISATEMSRALNVSRNTLSTYMYEAIPDEWVFEKEYSKTYPKGFFQFTEDDYRLLMKARTLKKTMTYKQVKEKLTEELEDMSINNKKHPFHHLLDFLSKGNEEVVEELKVEIKPSIDLIKLENKEGQVLVSSREVAKNFKKEHTKVVRDIENLVEGIAKSGDTYNHLLMKNEYQNEQNKQVYKEYLLTRDGFTLLAMGFTGSKALKWKLKYIEAFNKMEDKLKEVQLSQSSYMVQDPIERAKAWIREQQEMEELKLTTTKQQQIIGELKPRADYTDIILQSKDLITITQISKDYGMSGQAMNKLLFDLGVQYKQSGQWLLYKEHQGKGYTHSETTQYVKYNGEVGSNMLTKWTQKGRLFLYELLKEEEVLPEIEK